MSDTLRRRRVSDVSVKLRLLFIIYWITILFQTLSIRALANTPVSANAVDPEYSHIPSKTISAQIVGGTSANDGEFPYMAAVYEKDELVCGGVILSSQWVLTAARPLVKSVTSSSGTFELRASKSDYTIGYGSIKNTTLSRVSISDVRVHPQYGTEHEYYNLALIKLSKSLPSDGKWSPARITPEIVKSGDKLIAIGWGSSKMSEQRSSILQKISLTAGSDSECYLGFPHWDNQGGNLVCTISGRGRDTCYGDPGGPLVLPTSPSKKKDFSGYLVGIMNFQGRTDDTIFVYCGEHDIVANYFARVAKYVDWIAGVMGVDSSKLLATPGTSESDEEENDDDDDESDSGSDEDDESGSGSEDGVFNVKKSAASFPMKSFNDTLQLIMLCSLVLAVIAFNN
jgi:secreted trypsin-like serine protease